MNKNIAVIGGAGFIGSHIVDVLVEKGENVFVLDNLVSGSLKNINPKAQFREVDILDYSRLEVALYNMDEVYHLAAEPYIPDCYERPRKFFDVNAVGTLNVLLACEAMGIKKVMYWSSSEVYGSRQGAITEETPVFPHSTYAVAKLSGDRLAFTLFKEHGLPVIILRQFNCYGPRESHEYVIPEMITQLTRFDVVHLGNIKAMRDFLYVEDEAKMAVELMEKGKPGEVYNLGSGKTYSIEGLAYMIGDILGKKITIKIDKSKLRPFDVNKLWCDNSKVFKVIKGRPTTTIKQGLEKTINWYIANNKKWCFEEQEEGGDITKSF